MRFDFGFALAVQSNSSAPFIPPSSMTDALSSLNEGAEFKRWLSICPHVSIDFTNFDTLSGEYPELPKGVVGSGVEQPWDLYILTGSHFGVYEEEQWIRDVEVWIRKADALKVPILGICFGHQVLASALGGAVTQSPKGWEVGAHSFQLNETGQRVFKGKTSIHLHSSHQDIVSRLPECLTSLGGNAHTDHHALIKDSHIITLQMHPEFSRETQSALLNRKADFSLLTDAEYQTAVRSLDDNVDDAFVACACLAFLKLHPELE